MNNTNIGTDKNNTCDKTVIARCLDGLDYSLQTAQERIELVNKLLGQSDEYFLDLCDQDKRDKSIKNKTIVKKDKNGNIVKTNIDKSKYLNLLPTTSQPLSHDIHECKGLERISDYILFAPNQPRMNKQQEYSFYDEDGLKNLLKEDLYETISLNMRKSNTNSETYGSEDSLGTEEFIHTIGILNYEPRKRHFSTPRINKSKYIGKKVKMAFLKRVENYKFDGKITITQKDLRDPDLLPFIKNWDDDIQSLRQWLKDNPSSKHTRVVSGMIKSLRDAQIQYKTLKKGIIVFKQPLKDDGRIDYEEFDFFNKKHVLALLNMPRRQICDEDLPLLIYDLETLMKNIDIRESDLNVIDMYQSGSTQQDIADNLKISQQSVNQILDKLANNIIKEYECVYEDWYYLNKVKGKYKKCSRCGEIKLQNKFRKRSDNKGDGMYNQCKVCENSVK